MILSSSGVVREYKFYAPGIKDQEVLKRTPERKFFPECMVPTCSIRLLTRRRSRVPDVLNTLNCLSTTCTALSLKFSSLTQYLH